MTTPSTIIQHTSLYCFIVILSVSGSGQSSHNGLSEGLRCSLNQATGTSGGKQNQTSPCLWEKASCPFIKAREQRKNRPGDTVDGATLPPADRRNQNAASPEENSSFLLDFRAEVWTAWMPKLRGVPVRTRERKGISGPGPAKPSLDSQPFAGPKQHGQEVRVSGKILSLVGGAELRLAGSGPARSHPVRPMPVSWPWSAGSFLGDRVSNSPLKNLNGDVRVLSPTAEAPHRSPPRTGTLQVPCPFSSLPPPACERVPPVVHSLFSQASLF